MARLPRCQKAVGSLRLHSDEWDGGPAGGVEAEEEAERESASTDTSEESRRWASQLVPQFLHKTGVAIPGIRLVEGVHQKGVGSLGRCHRRTIRLVPVLPRHHHRGALCLTRNSYSTLHRVRYHLTSSFSTMKGSVLRGMKIVSGRASARAATAIAIPAFPPLLPTNRAAPAFTAACVPLLSLFLFD